MKTRFAVLALALAAGGCADNMATVEITGLCALPEDKCAFDGECPAYALSRPELDVGLTSELQLYVELSNQLDANDDPASGKLNTNDAFVEGIEVSYESAALGVSVPGGTSTTTGTVRTGATSVVKMFVVDAPVGDYLSAIIPPGTATAPGAYYDVVAKVRAKGRLQDQSTFSTAEFRIPIRVCNGCLAPCPTVVTCPPGADGQRPAICG